jgi:hypothetical protein
MYYKLCFNSESELKSNQYNKSYQSKTPPYNKICFCLNHQKGKRLTEPGVAVRTCAKPEFGADLVLALRRSKECLPLLATNIRHHFAASIFLLLKVQTMKPQALVSRWSKLLKWCMHERL